jgi:hypothetical protein
LAVGSLGIAAGMILGPLLLEAGLMPQVQKSVPLPSRSRKSHTNCGLERNDIATCDWLMTNGMCFDIVTEVGTMPITTGISGYYWPRRPLYII